MSLTSTSCDLPKTTVFNISSVLMLAIVNGRQAFVAVNTSIQIYSYLLTEKKVALALLCRWSCLWKLKPSTTAFDTESSRYPIQRRLHISQVAVHMISSTGAAVLDNNEYDNEAHLQSKLRSLLERMKKQQQEYKFVVTKKTLCWSSVIQT